MLLSYILLSTIKYLYELLYNVQIEKYSLSLKLKHEPIFSIYDNRDDDDDFLIKLIFVNVKDS